MSSEFAIFPKTIDIRQIKPFHAHITIEPLQRGYGHTLGNALRRVMMSSIPGFAPIKVKIDGVAHEYDRVLGLREDVVWLLLNLKAVVFRIEDGEEAIVTLKKKGPGTITAADITLPHNVSVLNGEHVLGTLTEKGKLDMEITVRRGIGYEPAAARAADEEEEKIFGEIQLDALYSPVRRAAFQVENARVASRTDFDRLVLDVETNGIFEFEDILRQSADILIAQFGAITGVHQLSAGDGDAVLARPDGAKNPMLFEDVDKMDLTVRSKNCLRQMNIRHIGDLARKTEDELMKTPHLGKKSLVEIKQALGAMDLSLGMDLANWSPPPR